jgi:hypothetical protein
VASVVWQFKASTEYFEGAKVEGMNLSFGKVPLGYNQVVPSHPQVPSPLPSDAVYSFFAETTDAPAIGGFFFMGKNGPSQIAVADLCLRLVDSRQVSVKCGTSEPYQEPPDLEKFVLEHRVIQ